jgi:hypothetical protein
MGGFGNAAMWMRVLRRVMRDSRLPSDLRHRSGDRGLVDPTPETVQRAYDEADLNRAIQAYRFFYPSVSIMATWKGNLRAGMVANTVSGCWRGAEAVRVHP